MKTVRVVAAIIQSVNANGDLVIFATQRGYGEFKGGWEFPGGKIEAGETPREALQREISEELNMKISVGEMIYTVEYDYPTFHLSMDCFLCEMAGDGYELREHEACQWVTKQELDTLDWLPADQSLIMVLKEKLSDHKT
ncbi:MAG: (deoxy)nucleoside triphosphate pyrophosphohydrolase [Lachnospiraceae bacterium]|nr:(deoxy)nucleoside triphosphate pyrophosphohydrolase [Lachnospiraceae bacterium]